MNHPLLLERGTILWSEYERILWTPAVTFLLWILLVGVLELSSLIAALTPHKCWSWAIADGGGAAEGFLELG